MQYQARDDLYPGGARHCYLNNAMVGSFRASVMEKLIYYKREYNYVSLCLVLFWRFFAIKTLGNIS